MSEPRWYGSWVATPHGELRAPIQAHRWKRDEAPSLPDVLVRLASAEYNRQGYGQSHERLAERGGLSDIEIICLLADALEYERTKSGERGLCEGTMPGLGGIALDCTLLADHRGRHHSSSGADWLESTIMPSTT